jgi:molybdopterin synthase sulfur carrier subunit
MHIEYFATIRDCTGEEQLEWKEPVSTLGELLRKLCARYGPSFERWVLDRGDVGKAIIILINGHDCRHQGRLDTPLHPDDMIAIFPMIAGG